ncbi:MAG: filamentous hemagglutinin N-terminal domain-containing protein [Xenococcaceae cyanobacterium]
MQSLNHQLYILSGSIILATLIPNQLVNAQIIPDNTLGTENSSVTPNVNIRGEIADLIEGGAIRDANLFHSFLEFNIGDGQRVFFANPDSVVNIFSRITGGNPSDIFGTLGVNGTANLFLINPNGIIFGENASLDVSGSFLASTAQSINFADGSQFSTTDTQTQPLLTVSIPIGLGLGEGPGNIVNRSFATDSSGEFEVGLQVQPGNTLALVGGEVYLEGGILTAEAGRIEIGSVAGNNSVSLIPIAQGWALNYEGVENFQDISLSDLALVDTSGERGGDIQIQGQNITFTGESAISSNTFGAENGGDIAIIATDTVALSEGALLLTATEDDGAAGDITINTQRLTLTDGSTIASDVCFELGNCAAGEGGNLTIVASEFVELNGDSFLSTTTEGDGVAGNLNIETKNLFVRNSTIGSFASIEGEGQGGNLNIIASESIEVSGSIETEEDSFPSAISSTGDRGNGGNITIETSRLFVNDTAEISTTTFGIGNAGNLVINASELLEVLGSNQTSRITSQVEPDATGNAGDLTIDTGRLIIRDGGQISSATFGAGQGGTLTINASDSILLSGTVPDADAFGSSAILVSAELESTENAGELIVNTGTLTVEDGARISADTFSIGNGANVSLNVNNLIIRNGGRVGAGSLLGQGAVDNQRGAGGILTVNATESVEITGTGTIGDTSVKSSLFTKAEGTGDAGDLFINTPNLTVSNGGEITAQSSGTGKGGSITATTKELTLNNGFITAATASTQGGNITLNLEDNLQFINSGEITASAGTAEAGGDGGNVEINSNFILAFPTDNTYQITAEAFEGDGGSIAIATNSIFGEEFIDFSVSSQFGLDGEIAINTPDVDPVQGLINLPTEVVDPSQLISQSCLADDRETEGKSSEFIVTGRGGLPPSPNQSLKGNATISPEWVAINSLDTENTLSSRLEAKKESPTPKLPEIIQARGWIRGANGRLTLVAENSYTVSSSSSVNYPQCH